MVTLKTPELPESQPVDKIDESSMTGKNFSVLEEHIREFEERFIETSRTARSEFLSAVNDLQTKVETEHVRFEGYSKALQEAKDGFDAKIHEIKEDLEKEQASLKVSQAELLEGLTDHEVTLRNSLDSAVRNALEGIRAEGILRDAAEIWEEKRKNHTIVCAALFSVFVALVLGVIWSAWYYSEDLIAFIKATGGLITTDEGKSGTNTIRGTQFDVVASTLTRVLLVSLPIGMIIWVLRAVLRIALLNLSLREDAAQRGVMIQTYVNLVGAGSIDDQTDRGLILSAIFRPLPGDQSPEIAPPSLVDLIQPKKSK